MRGLHDMQRAFASDLWGQELSLARDLFVDDGLSGAHRFNVYRNNFQTSLTDVLASIYPVTERLVGSEFFSFMANHFIRQFPSRSGNIANYGEAFEAFLTHYDAVAKLRYLADVARLEWSYHSVFHAAAPALFDASALQQFAVESYPQLRFCLGPASRLVHSNYPIFRIWKTNQEGYSGDENVDLSDGPESVMVVRPELEVELWRLDPVEAAFLEALESGLSLGDAVEVSLAHSRGFDLEAVLARHLSAGVLMVSKRRAPQPK